MSYTRALATSCIVITFGWAAVAVGQTTTGGSGARQAHPAQPAPSATAPPAAAPAQAPGVPAPVNPPAAPVDQPATSPPPSAPTAATETPAPTTASQAAGPTPRTPPTPAAQPPAQQMPAETQQTVAPGTPNASTTTQDTLGRNRSRLATQETVPPASRGAGNSNNRPNCSQLSGIEKSECERRDTSRDDLPAGVTTTQDPKPPTADQGPPPQ